MTIRRRIYASQPDDKTEIRAVQKVGKLIDSFLQTVAGDQNMPLSDIISLAKSLPRIARPSHDEVYQAINIYLNVRAPSSMCVNFQHFDPLDFTFNPFISFFEGTSRTSES